MAIEADMLKPATIEYKRYEYGRPVYYAGAILKEGEEGVITQVVRMAGGEWAIYKKEKPDLDGRDLGTFPLFNWFPGNCVKTSLAELTEAEFEETIEKMRSRFSLPDGAEEDLRECMMLLKRVYAAYRKGELPEI
tara:strand:- start:747 stop:1151 length:405 start_codon:yes stop_codon:yes gene_type:complete